MMRLDSIVTEIKDRIKGSSDFENVKVITAFPFALKATRLDEIVIALGISSIDIGSAELESSNRSGQLSVFADIYAPVSAGGKAAIQTLSRLCRVLDEYCIVSIKTEKPAYAKEAQAIVLRTIITFSDRITFGGEDNE